MKDTDKIYPTGRKANKRGTARTMYELYKDGMTVKEYVQAVRGTDRPMSGREALRWDLRKGFIVVLSEELVTRILRSEKVLMDFMSGLALRIGVRLAS